MASEALRNLISGERKGAFASLMRCLLSLMSWGYGFAVWIRNRLYDTRIKRTHKTRAIAVSVGNITTGGTGKTPVVAYLANWFQQRKLETVILSRGYKSLDSGENDEKRVLDKLCPGVPHLQNPDRVDSAQQAESQYQAQALVMDDAFQHRRISRNLDLVLIDASNPWGHGNLLPRGLLREPKRELCRVDLFLITRSEQISHERLDQLKSEIQTFANETPVVTSRFAPTGWLTLDGEQLPMERFQSDSALAFCGLGNPEGFRATLKTLDVEPADFISFPDHHHYSKQDATSLRERAQSIGATALLTTLKDLVKLDAFDFGDVTVAALMIELEILEGEESLIQRLEQLVEEHQG